MARRSSGKNEIQDPSLPQKKQARWRVIGAAVLALAALIILPLALESEPKQPLSGVQVRLPIKDGDQNKQSWAATKAPVTTSAPRSVQADMVAAAKMRTELANQAVRDQAASKKAEQEGSAVSNAKLPQADSSRLDRAIKAINADGRTDGKSAKPSSTSGQVAQVDTSKASSGKKKSESSAAQSKSKQQEKLAKAVERAKKAKADLKATSSAAKKAAKKGSSKVSQSGKKQPVKAKVAAKPKAPPPVPARRTDRNKIKAASPSGYVVQIGAFSSRRGANAQASRAKKLGFKPYTETITTRKGDRIRVRVGPYVTRKQANAARSKLKKSGIDTAIIAP